MINNLLLYIAADKLIGGTTYNIPAYMAFGSTTGTLTAADTVTSGEFDRNALTSTSRTDNIAKYSCTRTSTEANNEYINVVGLHNSSGLASSGNLVANMLVASLLHTTAFDVDIEFWISVSRDE